MRCGLIAQRQNKDWLWTALCRGARQIVAFVNGDQASAPVNASGIGFQRLIEPSQTLSDFWQAYAAVFSAETHRFVVKETGQTAHMERWNNTLRQRLGHFVRETLSFSKRSWWHDRVTRWFIIEYNMSLNT